MKVRRKLPTVISTTNSQSLISTLLVSDYWLVASHTLVCFIFSVNFSWTCLAISSQARIDLVYARDILSVSRSPTCPTSQTISEDKWTMGPCFCEFWVWSPFYATKARQIEIMNVLSNFSRQKRCNADGESWLSTLMPVPNRSQNYTKLGDSIAILKDIMQGNETIKLLKW